MNNSSPKEYSGGLLFCGQETGDYVLVIKIGIASIDMKENHREWNPIVKWVDNSSVFLKTDLVFLKDIDTSHKFFDKPLTNLPHVSKNNKLGTLTLKNYSGNGPPGARGAVSHQ